MTSLHEQQVKLEKHMATLGIEKFHKARLNHLENGAATNSSGYNQILSSAIEPLEKAIDAFLSTVAEKKVGRHHSAAKHLAGLESCEVAYITLKSVLDDMTKVQNLTFLAGRLGRYVEIEQLAHWVEERQPRLLKSALQRANRKAHSNHHARRYATLKYTFKKVGKVEDEGWTSWPSREHIIVGLKLIELLCTSTGLFEVITLKRARSTHTIVTPTERFKAWIHALNIRCEVLAPEYLPCVIAPKDWSDVTGGGYHTDAFAWPLKLVKTRSRVHKALLKKADLSLVYEAINTLQRTGWKVNRRVLEVAEHLNKQGSGLAGLPSGALEMPPRPDDYLTNKEANEAWRATARYIHDKNASLMGQRVGVYKTLSMAHMFVDYDAVYFPY